jgi:hypothetical protein
VKLSVKVLAKLTQILTELVQILIEPRVGELTFGEPKFFRSFNSGPRLQFSVNDFRQQVVSGEFSKKTDHGWWFGA